MKNGSYYGIDFGTTNTSVFLYNYEQGRGTREAGYGTDGKDLTPFSSCIAISKTVKNDFKFGREVKEKINEYAARVGLNAGDIYTFVFITTSKQDADVLYKALGIASVDFDTIFRGSFGWVRLIVKNLAANETVITGDTNISAIFDVEMGGSADFNAESVLITDDLDIHAMMQSNVDVVANGYAIGLIKSRRDADLRSNCALTVCNPAEFGLYWNDLLTAWKAGTTQIGASDLILEGGDE